MQNVQFIFSLNTSLDWLIWSPPSFYSRDIPQWSITTYHVYIKSQNSSVITDVNTTDTYYRLPSNLTLCDVYNVIASVTAFIKQYSSLVTKSTKQNTRRKIILLFFLKNYLVYQIIL